MRLPKALEQNKAGNQDASVPAAEEGSKNVPKLNLKGSWS